MHRKRFVITAVLAPVAVVVALASAVLQPDGQAQRGGGPDFGQLLMDGLARTEGCLGVDAAQFQSGKTAIIAWFEDADAVERWYYSETHARFMGMVGSDPEGRKPLGHVEDRGLPVMVVAALTFGGEQAIPGPFPVSQISIEMYTPLPGGAFVNGRLSPPAFPIENIRDLTPEPVAED